MAGRDRWLLDDDKGAGSAPATTRAPFTGADLPFGEMRLPGGDKPPHVRRKPVSAAHPASRHTRNDSVDAGLEDVYFSTLAHARRAARGHP